MRVADIDGRTSESGHEARAQRHLLLPALHALQERAGWISPGGMSYVCARLDVPPADAYGVATFYALFSVEPRPARVLHVCDDIACMCAGSTELIGLLEQRAWPEGDVAGGQRGVVQEPVPGSVRPRAGRNADRRRRGAERDRARAGRHRHRAGGARRRSRGAADVPAARAGRRAGAAAAAPGRPRAARQPRRLPRRGRLRGAATRHRARPQRGRAGGQGIRPRRPRRRRVPDGRQMGGRRARARPAALPRLQRRRVRARHVQGPRADRGRPLRGDRVDDDRRVRDRLRARLHLPARRVPGAQRDPRPRDGPGAPPRPAGARHPRPRVRLRHRDPQGRGRLHLRRGDGDLQLDRGLPRRAALQAPVPDAGRPVRQADDRQQHRDAGQRARHRARGRAGVRGDRAPRSRPARSSSASRVTWSAPASTRSSSGPRCAS